MLANTLKVAPPYEMTDEEFLNQAEAEIRRSDKRVISEIVAIGRKLTEIKNRVGHGRYGQFIRDRLWFSERSAQQFVQSYEFLKSAQCADFESLHIDGSALRLLAKPSTCSEVRIEALRRAAQSGGITFSEVKKLIANTEALLKSKDEAEKEARGANEAAESTAPAEQIQDHERGPAQKDDPIAELKSGATATAQSERAEIGAQYQGDVVLSQDQMPVPEATINNFTAPLDEKQITSPSKRRDDAESEIVDVGANQPAVLRVASEEAVADAKEPPNLPLSFWATEAREAIVNCVGTIKLTPEQCIATETEAGCAQIAFGIKELTFWFKEFKQLYAKKLNGEQLLLPLDDLLPPDDLLPFFTQATADEGHGAITIKRVSARPGSSRNQRPHKAKKRSSVDRHRTEECARSGHQSCNKPDHLNRSPPDQ